MKMITLLAVAAWLAVLGVPARADFADGLAAFDTPKIEPFGMTIE